MKCTPMYSHCLKVVNNGNIVDDDNKWVGHKLPIVRASVKTALCDSFCTCTPVLILGSLIYRIDDIEDNSNLRRGIPGITNIYLSNSDFMVIIIWTIYHDQHKKCYISFISVAHNIYGVPQTINSANYVYFLGLEKVLQLNHPDCTKVFTGKNYE